MASAEVKTETVPVGENPENRGLTDAQVEKQRAQYGYNEVVAKETAWWIVYLKRYIGSTPFILIATMILAVAVEDTDENGNRTRDWMSFGVVNFVLHLTVFASHMSDAQAASALKAVKALSTPECACRRNGQLQQVKVRELVPGDVCILRAGTIIPADGKVLGPGQPLSVDEAALTGESLPVTKHPGDELLSGAVVQKGELDMVVTAIGENSFFGKTIALLGQAQPQGHLRMVLKKAANIITITGSVFCIILLFVKLHYENGFASGESWGVSLKYAFALLSSVIPAAMPVVTAAVLAVGSKEIAKENALVQRLSAIEEMAGMEILCSDKTGTLTKNILELNKKEIAPEPGYTNEDVLVYAALASNTEHPEPIDKAITQAADMKKANQYKKLDVVPFDPVNKKVIATCTDPMGNKIRVLKGAPHIICQITANDKEDHDRQDALINERASRGLRTLGVAIETTPAVDPQDVHDVGVCKLIGYISLFDPPRDDTKETIDLARSLGVEVKMVTGDQQAIAIETAKMLGMGINICGQDVWKIPTETTPFMNCANFTEFCRSVNGFAGVYPEHKFKVVEALMKHGDLIGMTGDGVNDAPALKLSTVGIAVAGATEAAKSAADIALLEPGLRTIVTAIMLSRQIYRRVEAYIMYRICSSIFILLIFWIGFVGFRFIMPTYCVLIISVVNDITIMSCSKDNVPTAEQPLHWDMAKATYLGLIVGTISTIAAVIVLGTIDPYLMSEGGWWTAWGLPNNYFEHPNGSSCTKGTEQRILDDQPGCCNGFPTSTGQTCLDASLENASDRGRLVSSMFIVIGLFVELNYFVTRAKKLWFIWDGHTTCSPAIIVLCPIIGASLLEILLAIYWPQRASFGGGGFMSGLNGFNGDESGWQQAMILTFYVIAWMHVSDFAKWGFYYFYDGKEAGSLRLTAEQQAAKERLKKLQEKKHTEMVEKEGVAQYIHDQQEAINAEVRRQSVSNMHHAAGAGFAGGDGVARLASGTHNQRQISLNNMAGMSGGGAGGGIDAVSMKRIATLEKTIADNAAAAKAQEEKLASLESKLEALAAMLQPSAPAASS